MRIELKRASSACDEVEGHLSISTDVSEVWLGVTYDSDLARADHVIRSREGMEALIEYLKVAMEEVFPC